MWDQLRRGALTACPSARPGSWPAAWPAPAAHYPLTRGSLDAWPPAPGGSRGWACCASDCTGRAVLRRPLPHTASCLPPTPPSTARLATARMYNASWVPDARFGSVLRCDKAAQSRVLLDGGGYGRLGPLAVNLWLRTSREGLGDPGPQGPKSTGAPRRLSALFQYVLSHAADGPFSSFGPNQLHVYVPEAGSPLYGLSARAILRDGADQNVGRASQVGGGALAQGLLRASQRPALPSPPAPTPLPRCGWTPTATSATTTPLPALPPTTAWTWRMAAGTWSRCPPSGGDDEGGVEDGQSCAAPPSCFTHGPPLPAPRRSPGYSMYVDGVLRAQLGPGAMRSGAPANDSTVQVGAGAGLRTGRAWLCPVPAWRPLTPPPPPPLCRSRAARRRSSAGPSRCAAAPTATRCASSGAPRRPRDPTAQEAGPAPLAAPCVASSHLTFPHPPSLSPSAAPWRR